MVRRSAALALMTAGVFGHGAVRAVSLLAVVAFVLACGAEDNAASSNSGDVAGTYTLRQVDGSNLPAGVAGRLVIDGTLDLTADNSFSMRLSWRGELGASRYSGDDGTFSMQGNTLTFTPNADDAFTGQLAGQSITIQYVFGGDGMARRFVFVK